MPKEIVNIGPVLSLTADGSEIPEKDIEPGSGLECFTRAALVRWNRAGWVEVGLDTLVAATGEQATKHHTGYYVSVDRAELNRIIRTLQKAGRQAFGVDPW